METQDSVNYTISTFDHAKKYVSSGLAVIPICPGQKIPLEKNWSKLPIPSHSDLERWFQNSRNNIGIRTGKISGVFVVDVDVKGNGALTLSTLEKQYSSLPETIRIETPSGGFHLYFLLPENATVRNSAKTKLGTGIDIRGEGGQVLAPPSTIGGQEYLSDGDEGPELREKIAHAPQWLVEKCQELNAPKSTGSVIAFSELIHVEGHRNSALSSIAGAMRARGCTEETILGALRDENNAHCVPKLRDSELISIAASYANYEPSPGFREMWQGSLQKSAQGEIKGTSANAFLVIANDPRTYRRIHWDVLENRIGSSDALPWKKTPGLWSEEDFTGARHWLADTQLSGYKMHEPSGTAIYDAVYRLAKLTPKNAIDEYLSALRWDGHGRIERLLSDHFCAEFNAYTSAVSKVIILGAVQRALMPGSKMDYMPILSGPQGCGKTTGIMTLFAPWYREMSGMSFGTQAAHEIQGAWVLEIAELQQLGKSEENQAKAFLSRQTDVYRPPYGRDYISRARRCILIGTTNDDEFLRDSTGNRRYLPVKVDNIDIETLGTVRDQLFAEAMARWMSKGDEHGAWKSSESVMLSGEAMGVARRIQNDSMETDPWGEIIWNFCKDKMTVSSADLYGALDVGSDKRDVGSHRRIAAVMRRMGWERAKLVLSLNGCKGRGFRNP